ncbi:MAG: energy-coupling factor ABC transporter ATP-binding protein [Anaerolineae bacterium]|nr:energy-coupling factor ABC transporter ATP-binding protein [Anaerolineae bacterium]
MDHPSAQPNPIFEVNHISYCYDDQLHAASDISFQVQRGDSLAILGSNGSGKSTLLKILDGLYFPQSGEIKFQGKPLSEESLSDETFNQHFRSSVGFVFQDSDVQLFMPSVWEEVAFAPLQMDLDRSQINERVNFALKALNIEKLKERAPHQISGGEKKRVALASILSLQPEVWLLDEPSAGLDPRSVNWLIDFIADQNRNGKTIILATHDLKLAESTCRHGIVLNEDHQLICTDRLENILKNSELLKNVNLI